VLDWGSHCPALTGHWKYRDNELMSQLYPKAPPLLSLEEPVNLTPNQVQTLQKIINDKAKHLSSAEEPVGFIYDVSARSSMTPVWFRTDEEL
jgi:hypothetical protein